MTTHPGAYGQQWLDRVGYESGGETDMQWGKCAGDVLGVGRRVSEGSYDQDIVYMYKIVKDFFLKLK